jgi:hypothetical protein
MKKQAGLPLTDAPPGMMHQGDCVLFYSICIASIIWASFAGGTIDGLAFATALARRLLTVEKECSETWLAIRSYGE